MAEIILQSVSKHFGEVKAVDNFVATVGDGEFVSILGPSGCGKCCAWSPASRNPPPAKYTSATAS